MKKEILMLIIGILIGAIISTGVFLVLKGNTNSGMPEGMGRGSFQDNGEMPAMDSNTTNGASRENMKQDRNTSTENTTSSET